MIYFDYSAGAPMRLEVISRLAERHAQGLANPSSIHQAGRRARQVLEAAREVIARAFGASVREVVFTGSASEAAALAIVGGFQGRSDRSKTRIVASTIEHPCVLGSIEILRRAGAQVQWIHPNSNGVVSVADFEEALGNDTALCSLMWVNNETGAIQPVPEVSRLCRQRGILFHSDAVQAVGRVEATTRDAPASFLSFSSHKLGGPPGAGVLLVDRQVPTQNLIAGHQEQGRRGGTVNVASCDAMSLAVALSVAELEAQVQRLTNLQARFEYQVAQRLPDVCVNAANAQRTSSISNIQFTGVDGEALLIALDLDGICISAGAACTSGTLKPSHVLTAMGLSPRQAQASLRFSMGHSTTEAEVEAVVEALVRHVPRLRSEDAL